MIIGCQNGPNETVGMSDAELIQAIIDADKLDISMADLPDQSISVLDQDYNDYTGLDAKMAIELGYEVSMGGTLARKGRLTEVYFNMDGRKLNGNADKRDAGDKDGRGKSDNDRECFELVLPVTYVMPDGSTITVADKEDWAEVRGWYEANPDSKEEPSLQYPVQISFAGRVVTINNAEEMKVAYEGCGGKDDDNDRECFELVLPVTYVMPDGSTITVADKEDWAEVRGWYETNPDSKEEPDLQYPVDISYRDGTTQTISNEDTMSAAKEDCGEGSESDSMTQDVCEERGGTWTEATDRDGEYYCDMGG
jgi:hypothetical protein